MRTWIAGLLALTALSPIAASAQERPDQPGHGGEWRGRARIGAHLDTGDRDGGGRSRDGAADARPAAPRPDRGNPDIRGDRPDRMPLRVDQPDRGPRGDDARDWRQRPGADGRGAGARPDRGWPRGGDDRPRPGRPVGARPGDEWQRPGPGRGDGGWQRDQRPDRDRGRPDDWTRSRFDGRDDGWWRGSDFGNRGGWDRGWRGDRRYDWDRYRLTNRDAFRLPRYDAPRGWSGGYRRFGIGAGLSASLWDRGYWIDDPFAYRLPDAYGPYRWVRYYGDALLVDVRTGIVVDAAYGIFR